MVILLKIERPWRRVVIDSTTSTSGAPMLITANSSCCVARNITASRKNGTIARLAPAEAPRTPERPGVVRLPNIVRIELDCSLMPFPPRHHRQPRSREPRRQSCPVRDRQHPADAAPCHLRTCQRPAPLLQIHRSPNQNQRQHCQTADRFRRSTTPSNRPHRQKNRLQPPTSSTRTPQTLQRTRHWTQTCHCHWRSI